MKVPTAAPKPAKISDDPMIAYLPDTPPELAQLGEPSFITKPKGKEWSALIFSILGVFVGILLLCSGIGAKIAGRLPSGRIYVMMAGGMFLFAGVLCTLAFWKRTRGWAMIFDGGIATVRGRRVEIWPWNDIVYVYLYRVIMKERGMRSLRMDNEYLRKEYTIRAQDGRRFCFQDSYSNLDQLSKVLTEHVNFRLLPAALQHLKGGGEVDCDPFTLTAQGLSYRGDLIPWAELGRATCRDGYVEFHGTRICVRDAKIANLDVVMGVVDAVRGAE